MAGNNSLGLRLPRDWLIFCLQFSPGLITGLERRGRGLRLRWTNESEVRGLEELDADVEVEEFEESEFAR